MRDDYKNDEAAAIVTLETDVKNLRQRVEALEKLVRELDTRTVGQIRMGPQSREDWDRPSPYDLMTIHNRKNRKKP
jgi:hypothetical protein